MCKGPSLQTHTGGSDSLHPRHLRELVLRRLPPVRRRPLERDHESNQRGPNEISLGTTFLALISSWVSRKSRLWKKTVRENVPVLNNLLTRPRLSRITHGPITFNPLTPGAFLRETPFRPPLFLFFKEVMSLHSFDVLLPRPLLCNSKL